MIRRFAQALVAVFALLVLIAEVQRHDAQDEKAVRAVEYADLDQLPQQGWMK
jgi:hypothetical protein